MKKLLILVIALIYGSYASARTIYRDSSVQQVRLIPSTNIDTLQQQLKQLTGDSLKSTLYAQIAAHYLQYDTIKSKKTKLEYQNQALNYTFLALHLYSRYNDTTGLVNCFNNLSRVYRSQRKYPQAKWFILQSNTLSRAKNDVPNILSSLIELANIKMDIKDYSLAKGDLYEALQLTSAHHLPRIESRVQQSYVLLYSHLKQYDKEAIAQKRQNFIDDSIRKGEEAALIAQIKARDSVQVKKKVFTTTGRKIYKTKNAGRIASL